MMTGEYRSNKKQLTIFLLLLVAVMLASANFTQFNFLYSLQTLPKAFTWMASNLIITEEALEKLPSVMDKLIETIFLSITSTTTAGIAALFLALLGSETTKVNAFFAKLSRVIASIYRNIPIVAWALILLLSFGQNALTGYFALFLATFGFLVRAFIETIDETSGGSVEALQASGATYFQKIGRAHV